MRYLKILGLAVVAAMALAALAGAGAASATVLCKVSNCTEKYPAGTAFHAETVKPSVMEWEEGGFKISEECTKQTISGASENQGSATETVRLAIEKFTWQECPKEAETIKVPQLEVHYSAENVGTVTAKGGEFRFKAGLFSSCFYTFGAGKTIGTLKGGSEPILEVSGELERLGLCAPRTWTAKFKFTKPTPLFVGFS